MSLYGCPDVLDINADTGREALVQTANAPRARPDRRAPPASERTRPAEVGCHGACRGWRRNPRDCRRHWPQEPSDDRPLHADGGATEARGGRDCTFDAAQKLVGKTKLKTPRKRLRK